MDILVKGKLYIKDACNGVGGSGFILTNDGYIATNGHVASATAKDVLIYNAFYQLSKGNTGMVDDLAVLSGVSEKDISKMTDQKQLLELLIDKFYLIQDDIITPTNNVSNLLIGLNNNTPDVKELIKLTEQRKKFAEQDFIKPAKIEALDYLMLDGVVKFRNSDVAILKIAKNNLPTVSLGDIDSMAQGSNLTILGFPATASDNMLVDITQSKVTLTSGKVSALKNAKGSDKRLIETDATIGHGNSGGPAFGDNGKVIGIATYTVDAGGGGDGVFNYVRDIKDLKDLAVKKDIALNGLSQTQTEWEKGINFFYKARYSKALKSFEKVKMLYPEHPTVNNFIENSQAKIQAGQDVKDLPIIWIILGGVIILAGMAASVFLIVRHKKLHILYKEQLGREPIDGDIPPQYDSFDSGPIIAASTQVDSTLDKSIETAVATKTQTDSTTPNLL